jgi:altronate dehydratase large subunit
VLFRSCQIPEGHGLYLVDAWMSSYSLLPGLAASGAQLLFYQLGGNELPPEDAPLSATNPGIVAPLLTLTGNPGTFAKAETEIDFSAGEVLRGRETIAAAGQRLMQKILSVASGEITRGETLIYPEPFEIYYEGPFL